MIKDLLLQRILVLDGAMGTMIQRHKLVYKTLDNLMTEIHALSIHAFDENEFKLNPIILDSPECANR